MSNAAFESAFGFALNNFEAKKKQYPAKKRTASLTAKSGRQNQNKIYDGVAFDVATGTVYFFGNSKK